MVLETARKHLIGLVKEELPDGVQAEGAAVDHVEDTAGGSDDDVDTTLKGADIVTDGGSSDTSVYADVHVITQGDHNLLNLLGQLTGGSQNKALALAELSV